MGIAYLPGWGNKKFNDIEMEHVIISIDDIKIENNRRPLNNDKVRELAESIKKIGLLNPIAISPEKVLIAGFHRICAYLDLGHIGIPAVIVHGANKLELELAEIDENLIRNELDPISIGDLAIRRDEILEELGERATVSNKGNTGKYQVTGAESAPVKTTADIAKEIGVSERVLQENKQLARNLTDEVKKAVRKHDIPKTDALKIARMEPE